MFNSLLTGEIGLVMLAASLVLRSLHRWREFSKRSRSGFPLLAEALTAAMFCAYSSASGNGIFTMASGLVLASAVADYLALRITRHRMTRRENVRISSWVRGTSFRRASLTASKAF